MIKLTKAQMEEFNKTYTFLNHWVGSMADKADNIDELRFDGMLPNNEIMRFVRSFNHKFEIPELGYKFTYQSELKRINVLFNNTTKEHKNKVMKMLINYCFQHRVQPHRLRMRFKIFNIVKNETPTVYEYGAA